MITRTTSTFATSRSDDLAFLALADVARVTADLEDARVVGGLMVTLLTEAFPAPETVARRTADVDAAISVELANTGMLHERLTLEGYTAAHGNRYERDGRVIDLLVPSGTGTFATTEQGGRGFDAAPGLALALAGEPVTHIIDITLSDGSTLTTEARTPTVQHAVVVKALTTRGRHATKDLIDLFNLLLIVEQYAPEEIGGWRLAEPDLRGARRDAAEQLDSLRALPGLRASLEGSGVSAPAFIQLISSQIGR